MRAAFMCINSLIMKQEQPIATAAGGCKYYPRKMRRGWCVAHQVKVCGVAIERFGVKCVTYAEAFGRAEVMNREEAAQPLTQHLPDAGKEVRP